jgi:YD repeat-containing protein
MINSVPSTSSAPKSSGSSCLNGYDANSNLIAKTDARGIQTTYTYDALNRLTGKTYSDGTTPGAYYQYDQSSAGFGPGSSGFAVTNGIGRLTSEWVGTLSSYTWASFRSYDAVGRTLIYRFYWNGGPGAPMVRRGFDLAAICCGGTMDQAASFPPPMMRRDAPSV